jgi:hypothetical protein
LAEVRATAIGVSGTVADADLAGSVLLVAVTVAEAVVTGEGAVYRPPAVIEPVEAVQVTPWFRTVSPVTVAVNVWVAAPTSVAEAGATLTATGVSETVSVADFVGSLLLVAVTVAEAVVTGVGAMYRPAALIEPAEAVQVTPALTRSLVTVAAKAWLAPATNVAGVGVTETAIGISVIVAVAALVGSVLLVAVIVAEVATTGAGAVYTPAEVIEPVEAVQVTPALAESLVTVAVKVCVPPPINVADAGPIATLTAKGAGALLLVPLPQPVMTLTINVERPRKTQKSRRAFDMQGPISNGSRGRQRWYLSSNRIYWGAVSATRNK